MIKDPYTPAELRQQIASNEYSAELLLQHAMLNIGQLEAQRDRLLSQLKKLNSSVTSCIDLTPDLLRETGALITEMEASK